MKVPGKAWLTWRIEPVENDDQDQGHEPSDEEGHQHGTRQLHQVAFFAPKGLFGRAYWFTMLPFHWLIFRRMAHAIVAHAEATEVAVGTPSGD
jgi:hypothetical protein